MARDLLTGPEPDDIMARDFVTKRGLKAVGVVESITGDCALVDWLNGSKEIVYLVHLTLIGHKAGSFDRRYVR